MEIATHEEKSNGEHTAVQRPEVRRYRDSDVRHTLEDIFHLFYVPNDCMYSALPREYDA